MFSLALAVLIFCPFTVVFSHYGYGGYDSGSYEGGHGGYGSGSYEGGYGHGGYDSGSYEDPSDKVDDCLGSSTNENSTTLSCPSSSTRHYGGGYQKPQRPKPKPSTSDCSFKEEFPEGTTLNVTCSCPKDSNFEISTDGSTFDNSVKCDGCVSAQVTSNVFLAKKTQSGSYNDGYHRPNKYSHGGRYRVNPRHGGGGSGYYGRPDSYQGGYYGKPNSYYGGHGKPNSQYGSQEYQKPTSDCSVKCVVTPVTEPTTTVAPTTALPTVPPTTVLPTVPPTTVLPTVPPTTVLPTVPPTTALPTVPPTPAVPTVPTTLPVLIP